MRNIFLILKHEIVTTLSKRSFWIMTFLFPAFIIVLNIGTQVVAGNAFSENVPGPEEAADVPVIGYVDRANLMQQLPPGISPELVRPFNDEDAAQSALASGEIDRFYLIPADHLQTGKLVVVATQFEPFSAGSDMFFDYILNFNLTGDPALASLLLDPTPMVENHPLAPQGGPDSNNPLTFIVPFATMFIFFFLITMSSSYMLQSVSREKENRTVEVLLLSLRPRELMLGKVLGLSVIALFQMAIWMGGGLLVLNRGSQLLDAAAGFTLPPGFIIWAALYFLLGYLLYASLMGAIGALAPNAREGGQFTFFVLLPLLIPVWMNNTFIQAPNGTLALFLSLFPLTAPTSMMTRLVSGGVPLWQPVVGLLGLAVTTYLFVLLSARFFRADTLLSSSKLQWGRVLNELRQ